MKNILNLLVVVLLTACSVAVFDHPNDNLGAIILKVERDDVGSIEAYDVYVIKDGKLEQLLFKPEHADIFKKGDTIKWDLNTIKNYEY